MFEITSKNCYKCDLETVIDSNVEYFWINLRDFEVETERKWLNIFNKHGNKSTLKYRREIAPGIKVQTDKIFVRNDLFEQVIKICKETNIEFLMLKEKLGICLYEEKYYTEDIIQTQVNTEVPSVKETNKVLNKKSTKKLIKDADNKSIKVIGKVLINKPDNKSINELDYKSINELDNSSINKLDNSAINELDNSSINKPDNSSVNKPDNSSVNELDNSLINKDINSKSINELDNSSINEPDNSSINKLDNSSINKEVNSNTISWYDTDKFNKILATIDNSNFNHKNKIDKLKFNDINDLINSMKGNTISEADAKKKLNELNEIKKVEIKGKRLIESQKKLRSLFDSLLKTIFNKTVNESNSSTKNESKSDNKRNNKNDNESENESKNDNYYKIKKLNNWFETIDQIKLLEKQIKLLKERRELLDEYWYVRYCHYNKDVNYKIFKAKAVYLLDELNEELFEKVYGCNFTVLVERLINTIDKKEENQIIIDDIKNNRSKIFKEYKFDKLCC